MRKNELFKVMSTMATLVGTALLATVSCVAAERTVTQMAKLHESWCVTTPGVASKIISTNPQLHSSGATQVTK